LATDTVLLSNNRARAGQGRRIFKSKADIVVKEGGEMIEEDLAAEELDAGLISAAQRVEHYEIAGYGCVSTYAKLLGEDEAVSLLRETLEEEKKTDAKLTQLAESINLEAAGSEEPDKGSSMPRKAKTARA
jgi:ferritin-like metal-binding protein YciE